MNTLQIRPRIYGFFSSLYQVLDNLKYCEINNLKPLIRYDRNFLYNNGVDNVWNEFFEYVNDDVAEGEIIDVYSCQNQKEMFFLSDFLMMNPFHNNFELKLWHLISNNSDKCDEHRKEINELIKKYIIPNKSVLDEIYKFDNNNWNDTLSVHVRGTDYSGGYQNLHMIKDRIRQLLENNQYNTIFVASDNKESIDSIRSEFPNVINYDTSLRVDSFNNTSPLCHVVSENEKIKHGKDVLIESILLSKGKALVCINSNVAAFAAYYNPDIQIHLVNRVPGGG